MILSRKLPAYVFTTLWSLNAFSFEHITLPEKKHTIKVTIHTHEKNVVGIGCKVEGKKLGGLGNSYTFTGPKNTVYAFGYRKDSHIGPDIACGSLTLNQDSHVFLVMKNSKCHCILDQGEYGTPE